MNIEDLKIENRQLISKMRNMINIAEAEDRDFTKEEELEYSRLDQRSDDIVDLIDDFQNRPSIGLSGIADSGNFKHSNNGENRNMRNTDGYIYDQNGTDIRDAFNRYIQLGPNSISPQEFRALSVGSGDGGNYLVTPKQVANHYIAELDDAVHIRRLATTFQVPNAISLGCPAIGNDLGDPEWTAELGTGSEDNDLDLQSRDLYPKPAARRIKVSNKLLRAAHINPEDIVLARMVAKMAAVHEAGFLSAENGGANKPLGIFTASEQGINTDRDISTDNTTTAVTVDGLKNAVNHLKPQYRGKAQWIMHRDVFSQISKLQSGDGNYLLQNDISKAEGPTLLGFPVNLSEYAPNTFTAGKYVACLGDFSYYYIADAMDIQIQRLVELYSETNQTGYIIRAESDGMPVLSSAFVRVQLASS